MVEEKEPILQDQTKTKTSIDIKVLIKEEFKKVLPLHDLQSRNVTGTVLSYVDYREEVVVILQNLNHKTRAYIINAAGLKGYLVWEPIKRILKEALVSGRIVNYCLYHDNTKGAIDLEKVID